MNTKISMKAAGPTRDPNPVWLGFVVVLLVLLISGLTLNRIPEVLKEYEGYEQARNDNIFEYTWSDKLAYEVLKLLFSGHLGAGEIFNPNIFEHPDPHNVPQISYDVKVKPLGQVSQSSTIHRDLKWTLSLHIFAFRRSKSLHRLLLSLISADYSYPQSAAGYLKITVHVDGSHTEQVLRQVHWFRETWAVKFGSVVGLDIQSDHLGLEKMITSSIKQDSSNSNTEYILALEDDVSLSPLYFQYATHCITRVLHPSNQETHADIQACSLYTPRTNELIATSDPEHPLPLNVQQIFTARLKQKDSEVSWRKHYFLSLIPCSWGTILSSKTWSQFLVYYNLRLSTEIQPLPHLRSSIWTNSWKRYLIEYAGIYPLVTLYPLYKSEQSFSTNWFETGAHSWGSDVETGTSGEDELKRLYPDELKDPELIDERFTVPLLDRAKFEQNGGWEAFDKDIADLAHQLKGAKRRMELLVLDFVGNVKALGEVLEDSKIYQATVCKAIDCSGFLGEYVEYDPNTIEAVE